MVTSVQPEQHPEALALRPVFDKDLRAGAWWPQSRSLNDQFKQLFALWPPADDSIAGPDEVESADDELGWENEGGHV